MNLQITNCTTIGHSCIIATNSKKDVLLFPHEKIYVILIAQSLIKYAPLVLIEAH